MATTNKNLGSGTWTYRSVLNNPDINATWADLQFAIANLELETTQDGRVSGKLYVGDFLLNLTGSIQYGSPATLWFRGSGINGGAMYIYDYLCYVVPAIPEGIGQVPALVGSVTRAIAHPNGEQVGLVASFYAVLQP